MAKRKEKKENMLANIHPVCYNRLTKHESIFSAMKANDRKEVT